MAQMFDGSAIATISELPGAVDRDDLVLIGDVLGDQLDDVGLDVELGQVDRRDAVLPRQELGQILFLDRPHLDEAVAQPLARATALVLRAL